MRYRQMLTAGTVGALLVVVGAASPTVGANGSSVTVMNQQAALQSENNILGATIPVPDKAGQAKLEQVFAKIQTILKSSATKVEKLNELKTTLAPYAFILAPGKQSAVIAGNHTAIDAVGTIVWPDGSEIMYGVWNNSIGSNDIRFDFNSFFVITNGKIDWPATERSFIKAVKTGFLISGKGWTAVPAGTCQVFNLETQIIYPKVTGRKPYHQVQVCVAKATGGFYPYTINVLN